MPQKRLTQAEADAREKRMREAGIIILDSTPGKATVTLLAKREPSSEDMFELK